MHVSPPVEKLQNTNSASFGLPWFGSIQCNPDDNNNNNNININNNNNNNIVLNVAILCQLVKTQ